jgi:NAD(P)-dependent dehydrogenase (short-subunit alcohol dehydrogenase family)
MSKFAGKVALVTGGTYGIGRTTAVEFARAGAKVVIGGRNRKEGEETLRQVQAAGGTGLFVETDVVKDQDVKNLVDSTVKAFGRLDFAINNAGVEQTPGPLFETTEADYDRIIDTNVKGVFLSMKYEVPVMLQGGGGAIVNTSSIAGLIGMPGASIYVASKHAVVGMTKSVAIEYAKHQIRVNAVAPGGVETGMLDRFTTGIPRAALEAMHPMGRVGKTEEIAGAILFLCSPEASFITGQTLAVDGGFTSQ